MTSILMEKTNWAELKIGYITAKNCTYMIIHLCYQTQYIFQQYISPPKISFILLLWNTAVEFITMATITFFLNYFHILIFVSGPPGGETVSSVSGNTVHLPSASVPEPTWRKMWKVNQWDWSRTGNCKAINNVCDLNNISLLETTSNMLIILTVMQHWGKWDRESISYFCWKLRIHFLRLLSVLFGIKWLELNSVISRRLILSGI